jgi:hypothetical protein
MPIVERAERLKRELQGAARAAGQIKTSSGGAEGPNTTAEFEKLRRELSQGGRLEYRRQNL